jgi:glycosyltransferase involved in cell wall biosynthesis
MKILTIAATPFFSNRGCHIRIYNEAKYLKKLGNEVNIVSYDKGNNIEGLKVKRVSETFFYNKLTPGFTWIKLWIDLKLLFLTIKEIKNFKPDIIHAHLYEGLVIGYLAKKFSFKNIPLAVDIQGDLKKEFESYNKKNNFAKYIFVKLSRFVINWADWVIISSENSLESLNKIYKKRSRISIVKDGIDLDIFNNTSQPNKKIAEEIQKIKKWKGKNKILIYAGGIENSKGAGILIKEFKKVLNNWKLLIFGEGKDKNGYIKFVKKNNLENKIYFIENSTYFDLPFYLKIADVGIDAKKNTTEGSGKIINYMAAGLPIICFGNLGSFAYLKKDGIYMRDINELKDILNTINYKSKRMNYNLRFLKAEEKANKLKNIFSKLIK